MVDDKIYSEPSEVKVVDEAVALEGPDGIHVKLTPEAAEETSDRLLDGAMVARGKRLMREIPQPPELDKDRQN